MTTILCTLYNSLYLDKGLVLYDSLCKCARDFTLYVLCMDDKCYEVLSDLHQTHLLPIKLQDFECDELLEVKKERSFGEYCWTCSSWLISYVLKEFDHDCCTYIDADMYFYSDPSEIVSEIDRRGASVLIVGHRFYPYLADEKSNVVGKYCVEFNTFKSEPNALHLLDIWKNQVLEHCSLDGDGVYWGDQKYMDNWLKDYDFVIESSHLGAGVAPWNISQYKMAMEGNSFYLKHCSGRKCPIVFYHFENIKYLNHSRVDTGIECFWGIDRKLIQYLYTDYLKKIDKKKVMLKNSYGIDVLIKNHPGVSTSNEYHSSRIKILIARIFSLLVDFKQIPQRIKLFTLCSLPKHLYKNYRIVSFET